MSMRGKLCAMIAILFGITALGLSVYVLVACDFYEVYVSGNGKRVTERPGLFNCKYYNGNLGAFEGPTNAFDMIATIAGFTAATLGFSAIILLYSSHWKCFLKVRNVGFSSCLLMMAASLQSLTMLVLVSAACGEEYNGQCTLLTNAWLSAGAAGGWFLASCFNREIVGRGRELPK
jgi:hypothetical protein